MSRECQILVVKISNSRLSKYISISFDLLFTGACFIVKSFKFTFLGIYRGARHVDFDNAKSKKGCSMFVKHKTQQITFNTGKLITSNEVSNHSLSLFKA